MGRLVQMPATARCDAFKARRRGAFRRLQSYKDGHQYVDLSRGGVKRRHSVHRLVLHAFVGPCPDGMEACHNNGDAADNRLKILRWDTRSENAKDRFRHGASPVGEGHHSAKLTESDVAEARMAYARGATNCALAGRFGVSEPAMRSALTGKSWAHVSNPVAMRPRWP